MNSVDLIRAVSSRWLFRQSASLKPFWFLSIFIRELHSSSDSAKTVGGRGFLREMENTRFDVRISNKTDSSESSFSRQTRATAALISSNDSPLSLVVSSSLYRFSMSEQMYILINFFIQNNILSMLYCQNFQGKKVILYLRFISRLLSLEFLLFI